MNIAFWTIAIAFLVAVNCTLVGTFLFVRGQAMLGDTISHTSLLGIVVAFLLTNSLHPLVMLIGAIVAGMVSAVMVSKLHHQCRIANDVAINFTFSTFFSLAIILIVVCTESVDLDLECVLYGQLQMMPFDVWVYKGYCMGPKAVYLLLGLLLLNLCFIIFSYPTLLITSFDPMFASIIGVKTKLWNYLLMIMAAITTVITYKVVGSILVLAFLILPTITVYLLTPNLIKILTYACLLNLYISWGGYKLALLGNTSVPGAMVIVAGIFFAIAMVSVKKTTPLSRPS